MKKIILSLVAISIAVLVSAQTKTADYMKKIPALPRDSCNVTKAGAESYKTQISSLEEQLRGEIDNLNEAVDQHMKSNESTAQETAMKQMSQQYGLSEADMEKMKNSKNMSAAEKKAMADKMMQQQTNMSMDEVKNLSKMSDAGKKAYAEAYATEAMATSQTDPKQQAKNENAKNQYQSQVASQQAINSKMSSVGQKIASLYSPIESDPERQKMLDRMEVWHNKIMSMTGSNCGRENR